MFRMRPFPGPVEKLLKRARSPNPDIRRHSLIVLRRVRHPTVRAYGLELLARKPPDDWAITLLEHNAAVADLAQVRAALPALGRQSPSNRHEAAKHLSLLLGRLDVPDDVDLRLWCHERNPCALCREHEVKVLIRRRGAPRALLKECLLDANWDTRAMARKALRRRPARARLAAGDPWRAGSSRSGSDPPRA
jgi:hypothetical protein